MLCEICTAILSGGVTSNYIYKTPGRAEICHFFMAIDHSMFGDAGQIEASLSKFMQELRDSDKAEGQERIYTHGEKEFFAKQSMVCDGIPVNEKTYAEMQMIAQFTGASAMLPQKRMSAK